MRRAARFRRTRPPAPPQLGAVRTAAFTLLEMMAVLLLVALVFVGAIDFYLDLSRAGNAAVDATREARRATLLLDRVARDLSAAVLVRKPAEKDPLAHPWIFLAEGDGELGAEGLKLVTRRHRPRTDRAPESDIEMVAWRLADTGFGELALVRWSSPHLPERLDRRLPSPDDPGVQVVAEGVRAFGVRLLDENGAWQTRWDSSQLLDSSELPIAAEVSVALVPEEGDELSETSPPRVWQRRVLIPSRPLDLEALLGDEEAAAGGGDEGRDEETDEASCITVGECESRNPSLFEGIEAAVIDSVRDRCVADVGVPEEACR